MISRICKVRPSLRTPVMNVNEQSPTFRQRYRLHGGLETIFAVRDVNYYLRISTSTPHIRQLQVTVYFFFQNRATTFSDYALLSSK
jgi:hypothetical protein